MKLRVYIETTVLSYAAARPSRDVAKASRQHMSRRWWRGAVESFELVTSDLVREEAAQGDEAAAQARLRLLEPIAILEPTGDAEVLAQSLLAARALPPQAAQDAAHIAIAVCNSADYLVTWNIRHIANAETRSLIERVCRDIGYEPTLICTPEELLEPNDGISRRPDRGGGSRRA